MMTISMARKVTVLVFMLANTILLGQSTKFPLNNDYYHQIDRLEILSDSVTRQFHSSSKPWSRKDVVAFLATSLDSTNVVKKNIQWIYNDASEFAGYSRTLSRKPVFKHFFRNKADLYHHHEENFDFHFSPVVHWSSGKAGEVTTWQNTRGAEIRGTVDGKVGFYTFLGENQAVFPDYVSDRIYDFSAIPGENFWKNYKVGGVDWITARGYIDFSLSKSIDVQFGHDKNFVGNGYRSLILSDYAGNYPFLKIQSKIWRFNYTNIFAEMNAGIYTFKGVPIGNQLFPKKSFAMHHLSTNIGKKFNIGFFEAVTFARGDSSKTGSFDWNYLNPIIFYRAVEGNLGSNGNVVLGMDYKWNLFRAVSLYGQLVLDEFRMNRIRQNNGWWGNKWALQTGMKYINAFGIKQLDLQGEINIVRPYTYTHRSAATSYVHYNQAIAHPLGANFWEALGIVRYQPVPGLYFTGKLFMVDQGLDGDGQNWGSNLLLDNVTRVADIGNDLGQGTSTKTVLLDMTVSYRIKQSMYVDVKQVVRNVQSEGSELDKTSYTSVGLRWNAPQRLHEF